MIIYEKFTNYWSLKIYLQNKKIKADLSLGNLTDAGWYWTGNETKFLSFVYRIYNSNFQNEFFKNLNYINFQIIHNLLKTSIKNNDFYAITGDSAFWYFDDDWDNLIYNYFYGLSKAKINKLNEYIEKKNLYSYETFLKYLQKTKYLSYIKQTILKIKNLDELKKFLDNIKEIIRDCLQDYIYDNLGQFLPTKKNT